MGQPHYANKHIVSPDVVAKAVVKQLYSGKGGHMFRLLEFIVLGSDGDERLAGVDAGVC